MLEYTDLSITDICLESGFQSQRTFNRAFQERYKMKPREYKNECIEKKVPYSEYKAESEDKRCRTYRK